MKTKRTQQSTSTTKKKAAPKARRTKPAARPARREGREGMNIKQMVMRSAIREGFRVIELGGVALIGLLMGAKISF